MEIGGYFELELPHKAQFYPDLIPLNSGRSCLEYILKAKRYKKIYIPYYICDVVLQPVQKLVNNVEFYSIKDDFTIKDAIVLKENEVVLYVNYFGLMDEYIATLSKNYNNLIVDNAQAFFSKPISHVITYYSPRKFFGVSDGGYLSTHDFIDVELEQDVSFVNANYLLTRMDVGAVRGYSEFKVNEERFNSAGMKRMSKLTANILSSIDYSLIMQRREKNFKMIHRELGALNQIKNIPNNVPGPMVYPFLTNKIGLREFLITNKVFVAKYWDNVIQMCQAKSYENILATNLVALPIDQRYGKNEMNFLINLVKTYCKS